jgi:hypothetical protein
LRLKSVAISVLICVAWFVLAGCGGGQPGCQVYDQRSAAYVSLAIPPHQLRSLCSEASSGLSGLFGHEWSEHQNPNIDYSHDVRVCGRPSYRSYESPVPVTVYDSRSGHAGRICKALKRFSGFH